MKNDILNDSRIMACHTTPRLDAIAKTLANSRSVSDIGCDHAYLSILLARADKTKKIIATDISDGPLLRAKENVARFGLADKIELRLGNGLLSIKEGETEAIVIAGMGAVVISNILTEGAKIAKKAKLLVLQPMTGAHHLRRFLYENGYSITNEVLVCEDRRIYTIILAKNSSRTIFTPGDCYISTALRQSGDVLYKEYLLKQKLRIENALDGMRRAKRSTDAQQFEKILSELESFEKEFFENS